MPINHIKFLVRVLSLAVVVLILAAAAILRSGKIFGVDIANAPVPTMKTIHNDTITIVSDGTVTVFTKSLATDVQGFAGQTPLRITLNNEGVVTAIEALPNSESPEFFEKATALFARWQGKTIDAAIGEEVDAVSGATFSSRAIMENVKRGLSFAKRKAFSGGAVTTSSVGENGKSGSSAGWTCVAIVSLLVALCGAVVPLFTNNRRWHYVQLTLNVVVLGLWSGTFVSYALFLRLFAEGVSWSAIGSLAASLIMVFVALFYPLAGRGGHYCAHICPFGSAQELAGALTKRKLRLSPHLNRTLIAFRNVLWGVLLALMLTATWTAWTDYELFTAFVFSAASLWVVVAAVLFLILSVWVPRPYCRFVCPTGALIKL
jgi:NosR/NirI family transcriptional regulator, nitrous oxide reductase regulator